MLLKAIIYRSSIKNTNGKLYNILHVKVASLFTMSGFEILTIYILKIPKNYKLLRKECPGFCFSNKQRDDIRGSD